MPAINMLCFGLLITIWHDHFEQQVNYWWKLIISLRIFNASLVHMYYLRNYYDTYWVVEMTDIFDI